MRHSLEGGSPPRGRGRPNPTLRRQALRWLTPARAGTAWLCPLVWWRRRAHPRAGGDGSCDDLGPIMTEGSPPRGRGRRRVERGREECRGLTPARAGTAGPIAHTRSQAPGSPPRGRGRRAVVEEPSLVAGLTPARAGTAADRPRPLRHPWAHPRAGGDGRGLHPRRTVRGGLTPARAGTASSRSSPAPRPGAHPRAGGDGDNRVPDSPADLGSPPRGRGRRDCGPMTPVRIGLTPARAGTASRSTRVTFRGRAHPRAGGDGIQQGTQGIAIVGSPPRGRGRRGWKAAHGPRPRLTPARAGTACRCPGTRGRRRAHPRAGGDGARRPQDPRHRQGSPPRGRGRRRRPRNPRERTGLTPARAGTAWMPCSTWSTGWAHPRAGGDGAMAKGQITAKEGSPPRGRGRRRR